MLTLEGLGTERRDIHLKRHSRITMEPVDLINQPVDLISQPFDFFGFPSGGFSLWAPLISHFDPLSPLLLDPTLKRPPTPHQYNAQEYRDV